MTSETDTPEAQINLMMQRDSLTNEIDRWEAARNALRKDIFALEEEIQQADDDRPRLERLFKLRGFINHMRNTDHLADEDGNKDRDKFIEEELPLRRQEFKQLLEEGKGDLWFKRLRLYQKSTHYTEEIARCRGEAEKLDKLITPLEPTAGFNPWTREQINRDLVESWDESDLFDYRDEKDHQIDELEWQVEAMHEERVWEQMSSEREIRKKTEEIQRQQIQNLEEYIDQLQGMEQNVNEEWQKDVERLDAQGDLTGKTLTVYFNSDHQKKSLALRYKEDLANRTKWEVTIKSKSPPNKYKVERQGKTYNMALGVNEKSNHVFAYSFMSKTSAWFQAYKDLKGPPNIDHMTTYDLYQWHDKVEKYLQEKKARG